MKQTVVSLDPIDRKKKLGFFGKLIITTYHSGKKVKKTDPFGHYMFCGEQRKGKTSSVIWYMERLAKKYKRKKYAVRVFSNFGIGKEFKKEELFELIDKLDPYSKEVRIFLIDEIHTYFPKDGATKSDNELMVKLNTVFSQLGKRNCYVLSTAQVYGRLNKMLREQCLYMVDCSLTLGGRIRNEFIPQKDILCDELGRWAGRPKFIKIHGLGVTEYDTKRLIRE